MIIICCWMDIERVTEVVADVMVRTKAASSHALHVGLSTARAAV